MAKEVKTNAMRMLDRAKISYEALTYQIDDEEFSGEAVAKLVGIEPERAFKTLVARGERGASSCWWSRSAGKWT